MRMAMTRENSPEAHSGGENGHSAVYVSEPMGSLYEVTRLRNIRSNQAKTAKRAEDEGPIDDFITKGVISEAEAEELYS
ncbi:hypothetical protein LTS18_006503, partial [Coniosporium uncinatum]